MSITRHSKGIITLIPHASMCWLESLAWNDPSTVSMLLPCFCESQLLSVWRYSVFKQVKYSSSFSIGVITRIHMKEIYSDWGQYQPRTAEYHLWTRRALKKMGYSSRRPHRVPLLSAKNRKLRRQFVQSHQNWTIEDWKNVAWSDKSRLFSNIATTSVFQEIPWKLYTFKQKLWGHHNGCIYMYILY